MNEKKIIQIAANTKYFGLKNKSTYKIKLKNKLCGDEIIIEINKNLNEIRFETQSCIFTQASAAVLANNFSEVCKYGVRDILEIIKKKLAGKKVNIPLNIKELNYLAQQDHKIRKECIALPFNAVIKLIND